MNEDHECKYQDKIIEMSTDIKWIRKDIERRNGIFDDHVVSSQVFRDQVSRNTGWRIAFQCIFLAVIGLLIKILLR